MKTANLKKYEQQLKTMRSELLGEMEHLRTSTAEDITAPGEISTVPTHNADHDSEGLQVNMGIEKVEGQLLNQVDAAMRRIENGTYGKCTQCGKEIAAERLEALPYTEYCADCAAASES